MDNNLIGRQIAGYRLQEFIGDGGMGSVYRAYDLSLDRSVALKLMHPHFARQPEFRQRLTQEAQTAAKLDHPSIVKVYNFGESDEGLYIAMEYIRDGSLRSHLQRYQAGGRFMELPLALQIGIQMADALDYAHRENVIHRDVKPGNIILKRLARAEEEGFGPFRAVLTDFGLVQVLTGARITEMGVTVGTPVYMSPEQCQGRDLDGRSDLYSLGVVLYELLTNRPPFLFTSLAQAVAAHLRGELPPSVRSLRPELPPMVDALLARSLAKDPNARFSSGAQMEEALRSAFFSLTNSSTRVWPQPQIESAESSTITPPAGYTLILYTPDHPVTRLPLTKSAYTLGRGPDNDIVLPVDGVSRHHARLQATATGWAMLDLGGVNGTFLQNRRLVTDQPTQFSPNQVVRIGPYELRLEAPAPGPGVTSELPTEMLPGRDRPAQSRLYGLYLTRNQVTIEPGQPTNLTVEVENQSGQDDYVALRLHGLPAEWFLLQEDFTPIRAGERLRITIQIRPPLRVEPLGGRQRFRLELLSRHHPDLKVGVSAMLILAAYAAFEADITPSELLLPGTVTVSVRNVGNVAATYRVTGRQEEGLVRFGGETNPVELPAGQSHTFELTLDSAQARPLLDVRTLPFEIEVQPSSGAARILTGNTQQTPLLPGWLVYLSAFVFFSACFLTLLSVIFAPNRGQPTPIPTSIAQITVTSGAGTPGSAESAAQTAVAATLTAVSRLYTPVPPPNDNDADQLSNQQEQIIGTDLNNADSDFDGLNDGAEVLVYGTDPRRADTDGDGLTDPQEIGRYGTLPNNPDTDGDGIWDGVEISQGTNPRQSNLSPTATPTPAAGSLTPTLLPTLTPTPVTPGATPSPSFTPSPTSQPSGTPTVTPTATPSQTPAPSTTPSATPTATLTPSPTITPTDTPSSTASPSSTSTPSPTPTPTPTASPTVNPLTPTPAPLVCLPIGPVVDGAITAGEWPTPSISFSLESDPTRTVVVVAAKTAGNLFLGFTINDALFDASDSLRLYFDVLNNGGDPDEPDRFLQLGRDDSRGIQAGIGSNDDGRDWDITYTSPNWVAAADPGSNSWTVELQINTDQEMPDLGNPFGLMLQALFTGEGMANWPNTGLFNQADTWGKIDNSAVCAP